MNKSLRYIIIYVFLVVLQLGIFNNVIIERGVIVFIYALFFIILPVRTPSWLMLILAFVTGLFYDSVFNTGGVHAFSTVFIAYFRSRILRIFANNFDIENAYRPGIKSMGVFNFLKFSFILLFIHNLLIYFLEVFHFNNFFSNFLIVIINTLLTLVVCVLLDLLFKKES